MIPDIKQQILIVADAGREKEVVTRLARVGYDYCIGYLEGGFEAWKKANKETDLIRSISAGELKKEMEKNKNILILDVRKESEFTSEHIKGAENVPLDFINESAKQVDPNKTYFVHCAGGYRSMIFASTLRARGYNNLIDVKGGFKSKRKADLI
jgi:rhodanese-related sulfurtransferase